MDHAVLLNINRLEHGVNGEVAGGLTLGEIRQVGIHLDVGNSQLSSGGAVQDPADMFIALIADNGGRSDHGVHVGPSIGERLEIILVGAVIIAGVDLEGDDRGTLRRLIFGKLSIQLVLLERQGQQFLLAAVTDVRSLLIPTIEGVAILNGGLIEVVVRHCLTADVLADSVGLFVVAVQNMVVHRVLIPHHADDVGPAVDGDLSQALHVLAVLVLVPGAVVEPAFEDNAAGKLGRGIVVADVQVGQVQNLALLHGLQIIGRIGVLGVTVAVNDQIDLLLEGVGHTVTILVIAPQGIDIDI